MDMTGTERSLYQGLDYGPRLGRKIDLALRDVDPKSLKQALEENRNLGKKVGLSLGVEFSEDATDIKAISLSERAGGELNELVSILKDEGGQFHFASGQKVDLESLGVYRKKLAVLSRELKRQIEGGGWLGAAEPALQKAMILVTVLGVLTSACSPALASEGTATAQPSVAPTGELSTETPTGEPTVTSPIATETIEPTATPGLEVVEVDRPRAEWAEADAYLAELFSGAEVYRSADGYVMVEDKNSPMKLGGVDIETDYGRLTMVWSKARYDELLAVVGKTSEGIGIGDLVEAELNKGELMKAINIVIDISERKPLSNETASKRNLVVVFSLKSELGAIQRVMSEEILEGEARKFTGTDSGWISTKKDGVVATVYGMLTDPKAATYMNPNGEIRRKESVAGLPNQDQDGWLGNAIVGFPLRHMITSLLSYGTHSTGYPVSVMTDDSWEGITAAGLNVLFEGDQHLLSLMKGRPAVEVWDKIAQKVDPEGKYGGTDSLLKMVNVIFEKFYKRGEALNDKEKGLISSWKQGEIEVAGEHLQSIGIAVAVVAK